jgi:5'-phosphate synthase pdxT subunit
MQIGVLALQGDFSLHLSLLASMKESAVPVKEPRHLEGLDGLIIPGGESTTIGMLMERFGLLEAVRDRSQDGMGVFGTCAGAILLAEDIADSDQARLGLIPMSVRRNAYGRQIESFEASVTGVAKRVGAPDDTVQGVFIRAPIIETAGEGVEVLARYDGDPVVVQYGRHVAATFHPELAREPALHRYFLNSLRAAIDAGIG